MFLALLEERLSNLPILEPTAILPPTAIDGFISSFVTSLRTFALSSRLPYDPSTAKAKMPWWNKELWALRHQLCRVYQAKCSFHSEENTKTYRILKSKYQRRIRQREIKSWKEFCSNDLNGDLFGSLKKIADSYANQSPPPHVKINGVFSRDSNQTLKAFSNTKQFFPKATSLSQQQKDFRDRVNHEVNKTSYHFAVITEAEFLTSLTSLIR
ncbi:hypothetical protein GHT06_017068 [Daphnia sinensis]|uniref:Uncharacterized protein n=1 Tax=Daphnia sinensis TaxID=1820382 RepID=A0AAD5L6T9_9CRUS|nr:hypothetical protein GHT06_017068 [Daphnia sinensis]